jgi:uncharacterized protein (TIGR02145 family)
MAMKNMTTFLIVMMTMVFVVTGCVRDPNPEFGEMNDARDGQTYQTVKLGEQTWLAQDLNYETANSWCYKDDPANCDVYGRLYDWEAAMDACPDGWHLATDEEWSTLVKYLDPRADPEADMEESHIAGGMMKATGTKEDGTGLWRRPNTGATNVSGFSALPSGSRFNSGFFNMQGQHVMFWTATEYDATHAWTRMLDYGQSGIFRDDQAITKAFGIAVRCIKD